MSGMRLSAIQKEILVTIFENGLSGDYQKVEFVNKEDETKLNQLEKEGYVFQNELLDYRTQELTGNYRYAKLTEKYQMGRSALIFKLFNWQEYNKFVENSDIGRIRWNRPRDYNKRQATLTRSLQLLAGNGYVDLITSYEKNISVYSETSARRMKATFNNFSIEEEKAKGMSKYRQEFEKLKSEGRFGAETTFETWFTRRKPIVIVGIETGGWNTPESVFKSNYCHRNGRNISKIRLTDKGVLKAKELLKVNYRRAIPDLTLRMGDYL